MKPTRPKRYDELTKEEQKARKAAFMKAGTDFELAEAMGLTRVGYWTRHKSDPKTEDLLWPGDCIDLTWDPTERAKVIAYVKQTREDAKLGYMGYSWCRLCSEIHPKTEAGALAPWETLGTHDFGDGIFRWPEGYAHYIEVHGVKPPQYFIDHVLVGGSLK